MENLYLYAVKFYGSDSEKILDKMILFSQSYQDDIHKMFCEYKGVFFKTFNLWRDSGNVYYAHNLFIASIPQLFFYYSYSIPRYKILLTAYLGDIEILSKKLDSGQGLILVNLADFLRKESENEKVLIF